MEILARLGRTSGTGTGATAEDGFVDDEPIRFVEGQRIGPYRVVRYLGSGAMGIVYEALDDDLAERVAIKTLPYGDPRRLFRLKHEFRVLAGVRHDNLVRHDELAVEGRTWFFAMEFVDGVDLVRDLRAAPKRLRSALAQLVAGVQALHDAGVLHLDLKPTNIMVDRTGRVVILDFGLADFRDAAPSTGLDERSGVAGTPGYIAPERLAGAAPQPASDWFAVGVILFEILAGRLPTGERRPSTCSNEIPPDLDELCHELLAPDPSQRPGGAEVVRRLSGALPSGAPRKSRPLLGRAVELAALSQALSNALPGKAGLVRVSGVSGIGKTHLVNHALEALTREGEVLVLSGRCYECESVPYGGLDAAIDLLARRIQPGLAADDEIAAAAALFPVLSTRLARTARGDANPEDRPAAFRGVRSLLARVAGKRPVVLFLDDLHHAGADTAALLLDLLVARDDGLALTIVATYRSDREDASACLRELDARARARAQSFPGLVICLQPLAQDACETLLRWHLETASSPRISELAHESGGSPFLAELLANEATHGDSSALGALVRHRIEELSEDSRLLLAVVALSGQPLPHGVLLHAAPVERARAALAALRAHALVRAHGTRRWDLVEASHDRIADGVLATLTLQQRTRLHGDLAKALEHEGSASPELLVRHWRGAGELGHALTWALEAAGQAEEVLAFERAAALLADAASWCAAPGRAAELHLRRGLALGRAGRSAYAAEAFLAAADTGPLDGRAAAQRLAADAFMAAGHIDRGIELLRPMLAAEGLALPRSTLGAGVALVWNYAKLRLRGVEALAVDPPPARFVRRSDLCWSLGMGLTNVMPIEGMLFAVHGLLAALASGEPTRIGRGLAVFGAFHRLLGDAASSTTYLRRAREIAEHRGDTALLGLVHISSAADAMLSGAWHDVLSRTRTGLAALAPRGAGMTWEHVIGACFELTALDQIGQLATVERRASEHLRDAEARGDLYGLVVFSQFLAQARVAAGDLDSARHYARHGLDRWTRRSFTLQHFYALRVEVSCELYEGATARARSMLQRSWSAIERAGLLRNPISRIDALLLRARCALASGDRRESLAMARRLSRETRPDVSFHVQWIRARASGDPVTTRPELLAAAAGFAAAGMDLHAACLAHIAADAPSRTGGDIALSSILAAGVREPAAWLRYYLP